jgi:heptosyltransferase-2
LEVRPDCRLYTGYKPCGKQEDCAGCRHYAPWSRHVLIIKLAAVGDVLRTTTILPALKRLDSNCCITWLTDPYALPLLRANPFIDRLYSFATDDVASVLATEYDLVLNFEKERRALGIMRAVAAKARKGFVPSRAGTPVAADPDSEYALRLGLSDELKFRANTKTYPRIIFEMAGLAYEGQEYVLEISDAARRFGREFVERHEIDSPGRIVGLNTGCGSVFATKRWTVEGFIELAGILAAMPGVRLVLLGGPLEKDFNRAILERAGDRVVDAGCNNSLEEFLGLIEVCEVVVSADSLAMHLAIGRRKQVVALIGPTSSTEIDLFGRGEKIVADFDCAPCYKARCEISPTCMEAIRASTVAEAVRRCLAKEFLTG